MRDMLHVQFEYEPTTTTVDEESASLKDDWIGAYCIENERAGVPVHDYTDMRRTGGRASGEVTFGPMVNMRCVWAFRFVAGTSGAVLGTSPFVRFAKGFTEPLQVHLATTTDPTEMRVHWVSANVSAPAVFYGTSPDTLIHVAHATQRSYQASDMCHEPATTVAARLFRDPGQLFEALLTGLEPQKTYYYRAGDVSSDGTLTDVLSFTVAPLAGTMPTSSEPKSLSFFVFGDLNSPVEATENFAVEGSCGTTLKLIEQDLKLTTTNTTTTTTTTTSSRNRVAHHYVGLVHVGDISYAKGATFVWDQFGELIQRVAAAIPYFVTVGNHDYGYLEGEKFKDPVRFPRNKVFEQDGTHGYQSHGECGVPLERRFHMPDNGNGLYWYSFEMGLTHHTVLSGEHDFSKGSPMYEWLLTDFQKVDRVKTPWLFVHMHRPMYCSVAYAGDYHRSLLYRDHLEQLFSDFHVDAVFSGHYHSYERTCAVFDEVCYYEDSDADEPSKALAPVHLMVGSGGANVDEYSYYDCVWRAKGLQTYGYGRVHIYNASHMLFEFVSNEKEDVADSTWIVSDHNWPSNRVRRYRPGFGVQVAAVALFGAALLFVVVTLWRRKHPHAAMTAMGTSHGAGAKNRKTSPSPSHTVL